MKKTSILLLFLVFLASCTNSQNQVLPIAEVDLINDETPQSYFEKEKKGWN